LTLGGLTEAENQTSYNMAYADPRQCSNNKNSRRVTRNARLRLGLPEWCRDTPQNPRNPAEQKNNGRAGNFVRD